jgi:hypothetical protein
LSAVVLSKDGKEAGRVKEGAFFGEKALIDVAPRAATATGKNGRMEFMDVTCQACCP